ncbi:MAG TPA: peptidase, partial [Polyangiaceae bacterium]
MKKGALAAFVILAASSAAVAAPDDGHSRRHKKSAQAESPALALASLDRKIADCDAEEAASKKELLALDPEIARAHAESIVHGRWFYKLTRAGMLPVGGGFGELVAHAMRVER